MGPYQDRNFSEGHTTSLICNILVDLCCNLEVALHADLIAAPEPANAGAVVNIVLIPYSSE